MLLLMIELVLTTLILIVGVTQVIVPAIRGTPLFPFLRTKEFQLAQQRAKAEQEAAEHQATEEIRNIRKKSKRKEPFSWTRKE